MVKLSTVSEASVDFKVAQNGVVFAGVHLLLDIRGAENLNNMKGIQQALEQGALNAGATILHSYMHPFEPQGVSGVVVLAESHISIHTWPERSYAAIDIFMCGECDPYEAIPAIAAYFQTEDIIISEHRRGIEL
ncbi:MAG: adenosylmethionine decarboxylase [Alphaproteobacteria bacterium]